MSWSLVPVASSAATRIARNGVVVSYDEVLGLWQADRDFVAFFSAALRGAPWPGFRWETPPITTQTASRSFEFTLSAASELLVAPDPRPFRDHLPPAGSDAAAAFASLGRDAILVVPAPPAAGPGYSHVGEFARTASGSAQAQLWARVGAEAQARLGARPLWISTAGAGVAWLHVRLDDRPKYYRTAAYRDEPR